MALRQRIEWDPEEVVAGYDLSSIYEEVDDNSTAPVISSVVNTTDQAGPVFNITAGINSLVEEVVKKLVAVAINATTTTPITPASSTVVPLISSTPFSISTVVKKVAEHLGREPSSPVAMVCIYYYFFVKHSIEYITVLHSTFCTVYYRTVFIYFIVQYIILYKLFRRPAAFHHLWCWCWWWRPWGSGWG